MAAVLPFLALAGSAISAIGAIRQGNAAADAANYNANVMEQQAASVRQQTTARQETQREQARKQIGEQLAATSQSGTALNGSNLDLLSESLYNSQLDALNIRYEGEVNARGLLAQSALTRAEGKNARTAGYLSAASTLLKGGSSYTSQGGTLPSFGGSKRPTTGDFTRMDRGAGY